MKQVYKTVLVVYLLFLLWLVLFKFSSEPLSVLANYQSRGLNLVPFAGYASSALLREMIDNIVVFVPFGLLLGVNFKQASFQRKLAYIFMFSASAEIAQFVFAIGSTDITDVITNTLGGLFGLAAYGLLSKYINNEKLDGFLSVTLVVLLVVFTWVRFMVLRVRY